MKISMFIEKYFGVLLILSLFAGLICPGGSGFFMPFLRLSLIVMMFFSFIKTDIFSVLQHMKDYRFMIYLVLMYMLIIPVLFFVCIRFFDKDLAVGVLLLTAMPAGASTPALADIVKGNIALSTSIVLITALIAPFSVPFLFGVLKIGNLSVDSWLLFKDLSFIVFLPMIVSQLFKKYAPQLVTRGKHVYTAINILILCVMFYSLIGSQRELILGDFMHILPSLGLLFLVFIILHLLGFLVGYKQDKQGRIATTIGAAYMNNTMAIVLAASYFQPKLMILMVLSELPWNILLVPFRKIASRL